jgi:hypothetical protein
VHPFRSVGSELDLYLPTADELSISNAVALKLTFFIPRVDDDGSLFLVSRDTVGHGNALQQNDTPDAEIGMTGIVDVCAKPHHSNFSAGI